MTSRSLGTGADDVPLPTLHLMTGGDPADRMMTAAADTRCS